MLEGKVANLRGEDFDLDVLKIGVSFAGTAAARDLDSELAGTAVDWQVSLAGRAEVPLTAEDLARITQMVRSSRTMTRAAEEMAAVKKELARLEKKQARLNKLLKGRSGRARDKLARQLARSRAAVTDAGKRLSRSRKTLWAATRAFDRAASGLKQEPASSRARPW